MNNFSLLAFLWNAFLSTGISPFGVNLDVWSWPQDLNQARQIQILAIFDTIITFCRLIFIFGSCLFFYIGCKLSSSPFIFLSRWTSILRLKILLIIIAYMLICHNWYFLFCFHLLISWEFRGLEGPIHATKPESYEVPRGKLNYLYNF